MLVLDHMLKFPSRNQSLMARDGIVIVYTAPSFVVFGGSIEEFHKIVPELEGIQV